MVFFEKMQKKWCATFSLSQNWALKSDENREFCDFGLCFLDWEQVSHRFFCFLYQYLCHIDQNKNKNHVKLVPSQNNCTRKCYPTAFLVFGENCRNFETRLQINRSKILKKVLPIRIISCKDQNSQKSINLKKVTSGVCLILTKNGS